MHNTTAVEIPNTEQGSGNWLAERKKGITATDVAAILGASPFATPLDVWLSKRPKYEPGPPTEPMRWGSIHEPKILEEYATRQRCWLLDGGGLLQHRERTWQLASLDGWAFTKNEAAPWIVEAKTSRAAWDSPPDHYVAQVQWQLAVAGLDRADIACLFSGNRLETWTVERDQTWIDLATEFCHDWFVKHIANAKRPDPDPIRDAPKLSKLYEAVPGKTVEVPREKVEKLREALAAEREIKAAVAAAKAEVEIEMGDATEATVDGETVATWRQSKPRRSVDVDALKSAGLYDDYTTERDGARVFRVTTRKETK